MFHCIFDSTAYKPWADICREKIVINETTHYITFLGDGMNKTIITWNDTAGDFDDADVMLKTYRSATVGISSEWFIAKGVTFVVCFAALTFISL